MFSERCQLRKGLAELDAQERQLNLKIKSKENYIRRLESLGAGPEKRDKVGVVRERSQSLRHTSSCAVLACTVCACELCVCMCVTVSGSHIRNSVSRSLLMSLVLSLSPISGQVQSRLALLETQVRQREEERRTLHSKLQANQEEIAQVHQEVSTSVGKKKDPLSCPEVVHCHGDRGEDVSDRESTEMGQVKSLMRFMKQQ